MCKRLLLCGFLAVGALSASGVPAGASRAFENLPAWFEPNLGQAGSEVRYLARGAGYTLTLEQAGAALSLIDGAQAARLRIDLAGGNAAPVVEALDRQPARTNYLVGGRPDRWRTGVPHFARVRYHNAYPGIDVVYYGTGKQLEYDFVVAPGADPSKIRVGFRGADSTRVDKDGSLVLTLGNRQVVQPPPVAYQEMSGGRRPVRAKYVLARGGEVRFNLGRYDRKAPLIIDPVLVYAGYFGGSVYDTVTGVAPDPDGSIWLTGTTFSPVALPEQNEPYLAELAGKYDVFIAKARLEPWGGLTLLYWTYLGGTDMEYGGQIALGPDGMVYVTGATTSFDFPVTASAFSSQLGGAQNIGKVYNQDAFLAKINPASEAGSDSLVFSSYIGGQKVEAPTAMVLAPDSTVLVGGYTASTDIDPMPLPTVQMSNRGGTDGFLVWIDPNGSAGETMKYATYFGGENMDAITGVAIDNRGSIFISGYTLSEDLPVTEQAYQTSLDSLGRAFVAKLDMEFQGLDALVYSTYLGGSVLDVAQSMAMDAAGGVWLAGYTLSPDFPVTPNAFQTVFAGGATDVFLMRLDPKLPRSEAITYSTYFGGSGADLCYVMTLMGDGRIALGGYTLSSDLPLFGAPALGQSRSLMADAFVAILDPAVPGSGALSFGTLYGSVNNDVTLALAPDAAGNLYAAGYTMSKGLATTDGSGKPSPGGSTSGFLLKLDKQPGE
ncbi:MAG: SBBP repeat-containing protein [Bryobacteraceae bacterium]